MKKSITPEIKIALVAILGIIILFFGMKFLKGINLFSSDVHYTMQFDKVDGLTPTTPIYSNGFKVGSVKDIVYNYDDPSKAIKVDVNIDKNMQIPVGSTAEIVSDFIGNVKINLILGAGNKYLAEGDVITGGVSGGVFGNVKEMVPDIHRLIPKMDSILTSVNAIVSDPAMKHTLHNADKISTDLTTSSQQLNLLLTQLNGSLPAMTTKANGLLTNANLMILDAKAGVADARNTMKGANVFVNNLNTKVNELDVKTTIAKLNAALDNVNQLAAALNSKKGSLGLLVNDPALYNNLNSTLRNVDSLVVNLKAHPKRYVHFSIFGRKDK